jgi:hypothetical protein
MEETSPATLFEDEATGDRFLVYGTAKGIQIELRYQGDTLWMTQAQIADLFGVDRSAVTKHLRNIFDDGELDEAVTSAKIAQVRVEGERRVTRELQCYDLNAVISVGYRVSSKQATLFRIWATEKLVQFATKGFAIDTRRLKDPDAADRIRELKEAVRDIRADELNVYRELRTICAMCRDYDAQSSKWREFYMKTQAKLLYAVTSHTPAEIISARADSEKPNMGLQSWPNDNVRKRDVTVSKNYLAHHEITELNRLTTILLDIFEDQLDIGKLTMMDEAASLLDDQLTRLNRSVLRHGGHITTETAHAHPEREYEAFSKARRLARYAEADKAIAELAKTVSKLPKPKRTR